MNTAPYRHALYWAPAVDHPLWRAGCAWLGRDAADPSARLAPAHAHTVAPRRYGFHATLKAPIVLRDGLSEEGFLQAARALAAGTPRFAMPRLRVDGLHDFLALRPTEPIEADHPLRRLADACVRELDPWRAPPDAAERRRREAASGTDCCSDALLARWGYPHVFRRWRFHMTLSDACPEGDHDAAVWRERLQRDAEAFFADALAVPLAADSLCVFVEPAPQQPFVLAHRFPLGAAP